MAVGAHRGWRYRWPGVGGYSNITELAFLDRNLNRLGTPGFDGVLVESGHFGGSSYPPEMAFDGNAGTLWSGAPESGMGTWLGIYYDDPVSIGSVSFSGDNNAGIIEYSDDNVTWTSAEGVSGNASSIAVVDEFVQTLAVAPYEYWRVFVLAQQNNNYASLGEQRWLDGATSLMGGGTPSATQAHGSYPVTNAFDGNDDGNFWLSLGYPNPAIGYHFPTAVLPTVLKLHNRSDGYGPDESFKDFAIQYSDDGITWTTNSLFYGQVWGINVEKTFAVDYIAPNPAEFLMWRLRNVGLSQNGIATSLRSLDMHDEIGGADITDGGTPFGLNYNGSYPPSYAFDNNAGTFWLSNASNGSVGYEFAVPTIITEYTIQTRDGYPDEAPKSWVFEYSDGAGDWIVVDSRLAQANWTEDEIRTFSFTPPEGGGGDPGSGGRRRYTFAA